MILLLASYLLSRVGLVDLIGKGYNAMSNVFTAIVMFPLLTWEFIACGAIQWLGGTRERETLASSSFPGRATGARQ